MAAILDGKKGTVEGVLLAVGVALLPVYVFGSGGMQPSHMLLALFFIVSLFLYGFPSSAWFYLFCFLSFYVIFVEGFYVFFGAEASALINGLFFFYNLFLAAAVYSYCLRYGLRFMLFGALVACLVAASTVLVGGVSLQDAEQGRAVGSFNNPNQLGYFSVCMLSIAYLFYCHGNLKYVFAVMIFAVCAFLSIASLSKAAMLANFVVIFFALKPFVNKLRDDKVRFLRFSSFFWLLLIFLLLCFFVVFYFSGGLDNLVFVRRLQGITQEEDSSLVSRGYLAFLDGNAVQLVFGLGSELVDKIVGHEVHSTFASVFNNYGLIGFLFFFAMIVLWVFKLLRAYGFVAMCCLCGPAMLYGITHNGTRFTTFWILFSASMAMATSLLRKRKISNSLVVKTT